MNIPMNNKDELEENVYEYFQIIYIIIEWKQMTAYMNTHVRTQMKTQKNIKKNV